MVCFVHFDFEMCFAPQRRALFWHLNFQMWSRTEVFCTFWLRNVLRATTVCNCSSLIWPAGSAPAALASLLFDPLEPQIIGKTQCFATFLPFRAPASSFFWLFLFSALFFWSTSAFHLPILSGVWLLNFLRWDMICIHIYIYIYTYIYRYIRIFFIYTYTYISISIYIYIYRLAFLYIEYIKIIIIMMIMIIIYIYI